jgi:drug/metabolite transporter (DMT)-like permease
MQFLREAFFMAVIVFAGTGGEIAATRAMKQVGEVKNFHPRAVLQALGRAFRVGWMWMGLGLMTVSFFSLLAMLSWENVSFVVPASALSYAVGTLGGRFLLGERVTPMRWIGVLFVCLGVTLVWAG